MNAIGTSMMVSTATTMQHIMMHLSLPHTSIYPSHHKAYARSVVIWLIFFSYFHKVEALLFPRGCHPSNIPLPLGRWTKTFQQSQKNDNDSSSDNDLKKKLNNEFVSIAIPAFLQQAAVPVADLVDACFLRRLGPAALGGVGVARASQAAVSKLYNSPLSKTTISLIASKYGAARGNKASKVEKEELSAAVSTGLLLALTVGLVQLIVFTACARPILGAMGISRNSDMLSTATAYMRARALHAPIATLWLVSNGVFRGLGDTRTPFLCSILLNIVNIALDPILIRWGAPGVAVGTAVAQSMALIPLVVTLNRRVPLNIWKQLPKLRASLVQYLEAGSFVLGRTVARVAAFTYCSRQSALLGSVAASAYSITFQIGFGITLVCESITVAVQSLLSRELADKSRSDSTRVMATSHLVRKSITSGTLMTGILSVLTYVFQKNIVASLATSPEIQTAALQAIPAFLLTQLLKGLSFPVTGIIMGGLDWKFSMFSMWIANLVCFGTLRLSAINSIVKIWMAWSAFMASEVICGLLRYASKTGRWKELKGTETINVKK